MRRFYVFIVFLCLHFVFTAAGQPISYTLSPYYKGKDTALHISMVFKGSTSGKTTVNIPYNSNGRERP